MHRTKLNKKARFNALSLNIKMIKNQSAPQLSPIKPPDSNKADVRDPNKHKIELDPSIEQSLDKLNDVDNQSKRT